MKSIIFSNDCLKCLILFSLEITQFPIKLWFLLLYLNNIYAHYFKIKVCIMSVAKYYNLCFNKNSIYITVKNILKYFDDNITIIGLYS